MKSSALPSRRGKAPLVVGLLVGVAAMISSVPRAQAGEAPEAVAESSRPASYTTSNPFADRFPNVVLKTHEGKNVRFYDDLLRGKIVLINFMYATCKER